MTRALLALLRAAECVCAGEAFYDLTPGKTWVFAYHNVVSLDHPTYGMTNVTDGTMRVKVIGDYVTNGVTYTQLETSYENIFGIAPQLGYIRVDEDGVYTASEIRGVFAESPIIKFPIEVGKSWDYYDGEKGRRRIAEVGTMKIGERTFENCVKIERVFDDPEKDGQWTHTDYYAPGFGNVRFHFIQKLGPTLSDTMATLVEP